ncbi:hypothetical protein [Mesobacillus jeotgali]|uniref:hypothetical protein n=1 Tax=Mesobacillus jeotgali TaxID=129985 RepID=UPI001115EA01|nr:hypothetical protein [Mesobacillus jeotgali]
MMESIYFYDDQKQFLRIEFYTASKKTSWEAYVFDDSWNDVYSSASSISENVEAAIIFAKETMGIAGRAAVLVNLLSDDLLSESVNLSLFHLQALLYVSIIMVEGDYAPLEKMGFAKEITPGGRTVYYLSSEEAEGNSCRFL